MSGGEEPMAELRFRLFDGTDLGHRTYPSSATIASLKQMLLDEWPQDKPVPESIMDIRLILAGGILDNRRTLAQSNIPFGRPAGEVITIHVVVLPASERNRTGRNNRAEPNMSSCACTIL